MKEMPSSLLSEWMAFSKLEPFGFLAELFGFSIVSSVIANVNRKKGTKIFKPEDFLPEERSNENKGSFFENLKNYFKYSTPNNGKKK